MSPGLNPDQALNQIWVPKLLVCLRLLYPLPMSLRALMTTSSQWVVLEYPGDSRKPLPKPPGPIIAAPHDPSLLGMNMLHPLLTWFPGSQIQSSLGVLSLSATRGHASTWLTGCWSEPME